MEEARTAASEPDDGLLLRRAQAGDRDAFEHVVVRHQRRVYAVALRIVRRHEVADDVAQEAFVRAWQSLGSFDPGRPFGPWIARIARNLALNTLRGPASRVEPLPEGPAEPVDAAPGPESDVMSREVREAVSAALAGLPADQREVFLLRASGELSYEEIGAELGLAPGTVMSRLFRAREKLRAALGPWLRAASGATR